MGTKKPEWLVSAEADIGLKEIKGVEHESRILRFWRSIKQGSVHDDETPWCAAFVGAKLEECGIQSPRSGWARDYLKWGVPLSAPVLGCIVVLSRPGGGGHVFFATAVDGHGRIGGIGGNQSDSVSFAWFDRERVLGYRWPPGIALSDSARLVAIASLLASSQNEA